MVTKKQNEANQKNALLSTGAITAEGKVIVSLNAIKHGVFAKDLIVASGIGRENEKEYYEILNNLIDCLSPQNQIESLLVEKISMDFWRLRRVIRFETGSIQKYIDETIKSCYDSYMSKTNIELEKDIEQNKSCIKWNVQYLECLKNNLVTFDYPNWKGKDIESDIIEDFYLITNNMEYSSFTKEEKEKLQFGKFNFSELKAVLKKNGYSSTKEITTRLVELYSKQNQELEEEMLKLEQKKTENIAMDKLNTKICAIPKDENIDKVLKYEKSIQRSIFQNLLLLKKLQGSF